MCIRDRALDMLQAMNTGHEGSMTTIHSNSPRDALRRIENMVSMAGIQYPVHVIRDQMASTLDLIVQVSRMTGGRRKIMTIAELTGLEREVVLMQDIFHLSLIHISEPTRLLSISYAVF